MRTTKRDFLNLTDLSGAEAREVLALATMLKREPKRPLVAMKVPCEQDHPQSSSSRLFSMP